MKNPISGLAWIHFDRKEVTKVTTVSAPTKVLPEMRSSVKDREVWFWFCDQMSISFLWPNVNIRPRQIFFCDKSNEPRGILETQITSLSVSADDEMNGLLKKNLDVCHASGEIFIGGEGQNRLGDHSLCSAQCFKLGRKHFLCVSQICVLNYCSKLDIFSIICQELLKGMKCNCIVPPIQEEMRIQRIIAESISLPEILECGGRRESNPIFAMPEFCQPCL